ncbi:MAG: histidine kinase N-terminal domain-containing protein [Actinomycetota bacterium]
MTTFSSRMSDDTTLWGEAGDHLRRLVSWWGLLADFAFADLLLFAPSRDEPGEMVMIGHMRPTTSATLYDDDVIGRAVSEVERPLVSRASRLGQLVVGEVTLPDLGVRARVECVPVRWRGETIAILTREAPPGPRRGSELETVYLGVWHRLARMIAAGSFPFPADDTDTEEAPRVGDGVTVLDGDARITYASPNATSTLHRLGVSGQHIGTRLAELGVESTVVRRAFLERTSVNEEVERGEDSIVDVLAVPLLDGTDVCGGVVILRDVSELRQRDRLLISKDATIREIHHRVKNNLQTITALLRLQARRLDSAEARTVLEESVRRIASIALVHETLAHEAGKDVPLVGVVDDLVRMFGDSVRAPERPITLDVEGDPGIVPAELVTPLAVVLNELLQNTVDHASDGGSIEVVVSLDRHGDELAVGVTDNGPGLPDGFDVDQATGLGLSIVRALVGSDLGGRIEMRSRADGGGSVARILVPLKRSA